MPQEMRQAPKDRCYGDDCQEAVVLPSLLDGDATVYAILIIGLAPRRPYDDAYQAWIRSLHRTFANAVASIALADAMALAKANVRKRTARDREVFAKELSLKKAEAEIAAGRIQRMQQIMEASRSVDFSTALCNFLRNSCGLIESAFLNACHPERSRRPM